MMLPNGMSIAFPPCASLSSPLKKAQSPSRSPTTPSKEAETNKYQWVMIFVLFFGSVVAAFLSSPSVADSSLFVFPFSNLAWRRQTQTQQPMSLDPNWDNADYLSSLGGSPDDIDDANDKYYRHSESRSALEVWRKRQSSGRKHYEHNMYYDANGNPIFVPMLQDDMDGNSLSEWTKIAIPTPSTMTTRDSLAWSVACVEAILKMFSEASIRMEERNSMFLLLNESLIMAVINSERYIADSKRGELREEAIRWDSAVGIPESYIKTNLPNKEIDRNFQDVYTALQNAMGNEGRLGLRSVSGKEANYLSSMLLAMRELLLDDLINLH